MSEEAIVLPKIRKMPAQKMASGPYHRVVREIMKRPGFLISLGFLGILIIIAIFAPIIAPYDPNGIDLPHKNLGVSSTHIWGTDYLGRDLFSRTIWGTQTSLIIAFTTVGCAFVVGTLVGCIAAYYGGVVDEILSRCIDLFLAFPGIIFLLPWMSDLLFCLPLASVFLDLEFLREFLSGVR